MWESSSPSLGLSFPICDRVVGLSDVQPWVFIYPIISCVGVWGVVLHALCPAMHLNSQLLWWCLGLTHRSWIHSGLLSLIQAARNAGP